MCVLAAVVWVVSCPAGLAEDRKEPAKQVPVETLEDVEVPQSGEDFEESVSSDAELTTGTVVTSERKRDADATASKDASGAKYEDGSIEQAEEDITADDDSLTEDASNSDTALDSNPEKKPLKSGASFTDDARGPDKRPPDATDAAGASAGLPGLPRRKPRKPVVRKRENDRTSRRPNSALRRTDRDRHLCTALQACRNDFVRCKAKIKHPDQSPEWSAEKEACGAVYKSCVQKDFQGGEWFFTRWFYFQELNCK